jgi:hypothetical protein
MGARGKGAEMAILHEKWFPDSRMERGDTLFSRLTAFKLDMQSDGNLVLYTEHMRPLWASGTVGTGFFARMQSDGNLVVYDVADRPVWASDTPGNPGAFLWCQDDGNLVLYQGGVDPRPETALWATNTCAGCG